jgi:hypothetical protein
MNMRKFALVIAAATAIGSITPALAETVKVRIGDGYHHRHHVRERVVIRTHRHWNRGHHYGWDRHHHRHGAKIVIR